MIVVTKCFATVKHKIHENNTQRCFLSVIVPSSLLSSIRTFKGSSSYLLLLSFIWCVCVCVCFFPVVRFSFMFPALSLFFYLSIKYISKSKSCSCGLHDSGFFLSSSLSLFSVVVVFFCQFSISHPFVLPLHINFDTVLQLFLSLKSFYSKSWKICVYNKQYLKYILHQCTHHQVFGPLSLYQYEALIHLYVWHGMARHGTAWQWLIYILVICNFICDMINAYIYIYI